MQTRLLINSIQDSVFRAFVGMQVGRQFKLETFCDLVLKLYLGLEHVSGRPCLSEGETILGIYVLGLNVAMNGVMPFGSMKVRLNSVTGHFKGDIVGSACLYFKSSARDVEIFGEKVA